MSETTLLTPSTQTPDRAMLAGIALSSFSALLLELALTRLFSVVLFYHFAFLAISIALLGLGAGGVFAFLYRDRLRQIDLGVLATHLCWIQGASTLAVLEVVTHLSISLNLTWANMARLAAMYLSAAVPFFVTGLL